MQDIFSHTNISDNEPVIVPALSYLEKFEDITKNTPKSSVYIQYLCFSIFN